ncbi:V(D)J recombination-activating protein 1-like [Diadema antillarum]|uniref:V(D)J recombination-activating protein 1-like n=1 Tax=Diadema antillarum TaxID=105358 RepID=UPI003A84FA68
MIHERSDRLLPEKAFHASFVVLRCEVEKDGQMRTVYKQQDPNLVFAARPLLEAIGDENNKASAQQMLELMEKDRVMIQKREMRVYIDETRRWHHKIRLFNSMIDEKLDRAEGGLQSRYICTLCFATKETAKSNLGSFNISRSREETAANAQYAWVNLDKISQTDLPTETQGAKATPVLTSEPKHRLIDDTHADINLGAFVKKIVICEMGRVQL